jgi:MYXO-CTERM domain-containing protein
MRLALWAGAVSALLFTQSAHAYSTRIHIALANDLRKALIASGNGSIALRHSGYSVVLPPADAQAIIDHPLEFRAGAVGPDNMAFPGMTDPSHALEQRPFEQCELLYQAALTGSERAFAAGCFLHGATDAIAHHYVNFMSGETFTLTPITSARQSSWDNVVRHIVAESMIQDSAYAARPEEFTFGNLTHAIPKDFVLRAYLSENSPLWQVMAARAKARFDAAKAQNPNGSLVSLIAAADLAPADQIVMAPVYLREIEVDRQALRANIEQTIQGLQNPATTDGNTLKVTPGADGKLGTSDDGTACSASCPTLYAKYKVYVALLEPRQDASGSPLPSAFDKLSDELRDDLFGFLPALVDSVENVSNKLNEPLSPGSPAFNLNKSELAVLFAPMTNWADDLTTIDYATLAAALLPDWLQKLQAALNAVGVNIQVPNLIEALLDPVVQPIKDAIRGYVIDQAQQTLGELVDQYNTLLPGTKAEYQVRLQTAAPPGLGGTALDHLHDSGLYAHSFNIAATALANHQAVLPEGDDPVGIGPASFDASHTPAWMQPGLCDYLRAAVFPLGIDVRGALSVRNSSGDFAANLTSDSPVECHDGSLSAFAESPRVDSCSLIDVAGLIADPEHQGTVSRAHPPQLASVPPSCRYITIEGLPPPPPGMGGSGGGGGSGGAVNPGVPTSTGGSSSGCGCRVTSGTQGSSAALLALLAAVALRRRRRRTPAEALLALPLLVSACGGGDSSTGVPAGGSGGTGGSAAGSSSGGGAGEAGSGGSSATGGTGAFGGTGGGGSQAQALIDALGTSVWHALLEREGKQRAFELRFDASSLLWAEIRNPYGPARKREMRVMQIAADGKSVHTTVKTPPGWPIGPENGRQDDWTIEVVGSSPRSLITTRNGVVESYEEGAWPAPTSGLTAIVRVFASGGKTADAFCNKSTWSAPDRIPIWEFARGKSSEQAVEQDIVAGAPLLTWQDLTGFNQFAVTDVHGFKDLGGTELSDQFNFVVRYVGTVTHGGGQIAMRELDDDVKDALWSWLGPGVGSSLTSDLFLEVHGHVPADLTVDAPTGFFAGGAVPIEIVILRCSQKIQTIDVQIDTGSGWKLVGNVPTLPQLDATLFPPAL